MPVRLLGRVQQAEPSLQGEDTTGRHIDLRSDLSVALGESIESGEGLVAQRDVEAGQQGGTAGGGQVPGHVGKPVHGGHVGHDDALEAMLVTQETRQEVRVGAARDRKSTRLNSSHVASSYAVFCLKKKKRRK